MKNTKKFFLVLTFIICFGTALSSVAAAHNYISNIPGDNPISLPGPAVGSDTIENNLSKIWGTAVSVVQMIAFGTVIFTGLRYIFASSDKRADIKKGLTSLAIGAIFVFAASTVVKFVVGIGDGIF